MSQILSLIVGVIAMSAWNMIFREAYVNYIEAQARLYTGADDIVASLVVLGVAYLVTLILIRRIRRGEET